MVLQLLIYCIYIVFYTKFYLKIGNQAFYQKFIIRLWTLRKTLINKMSFNKTNHNLLQRAFVSHIYKTSLINLDQNGLLWREATGKL